MEEQIIMDFLALASMSCNPEDYEEIDTFIKKHWHKTWKKFDKISFEELLLMQEEAGLR